MHLAWTVPPFRNDSKHLFSLYCIVSLSHVQWLEPVPASFRGKTENAVDRPPVRCRHTLTVTLSVTPTIWTSRVTKAPGLVSASAWAMCVCMMRVTCVVYNIYSRYSMCALRSSIPHCDSYLHNKLDHLYRRYTAEHERLKRRKRKQCKLWTVWMWISCLSTAWSYPERSDTESNTGAEPQYTHWPW